MHNKIAQEPLSALINIAMNRTQEYLALISQSDQEHLTNPKDHPLI